ncbi:hypothetical protein [Comamonas sp. JC664]|uniref:hypothetical protein n=1 Tax=Comamonas sp. JC664 TaxID=2801917 RepID=UPI00361412B5
MVRRLFVARLLAKTTEALVVTGLGSASYDVFAAGDRDPQLYLVGRDGRRLVVGAGHCAGPATRAR